MSQPPTKKRFQFQLSTALAMMVAASACVGLGVLQFKNAELEKEKNKQVGELENEIALLRSDQFEGDEDMIVSTPLHTTVDRTWAWNVYFGDDCQINVSVNMNNIGGASEVVNTTIPMKIKRGLYRMRAEIQRSPEGKAGLKLTLPTHSDTPDVREFTIASKSSASDWIFYRKGKHAEEVHRQKTNGNVWLLYLTDGNPVDGTNPRIWIVLERAAIPGN